MIDHPVITCEHGGNRIPPPYRHFFQTGQDRALLDSHRGFDAGALLLAEEMAARLAAPLVASRVSRLLVDLNRSPSHPRVFCPAVRATPATIRKEIMDRYYRPYRSRAERLIQAGINQGQRVVHVSCHSFTPELDGTVRDADIGLLYDPARTAEADFCRRWQASLQACAPQLKVRRNYPYAGKNDGFTTHLRRCFPDRQYLGIELELNQKQVARSGRGWAPLRAGLIESLRLLLGLPEG